MRIRFGHLGNPFDMDDAAGYFVLVAVFWLLAGLAHWIWF